MLRSGVPSTIVTTVLLALSTLACFAVPAAAQDKTCMECHADNVEYPEWRPVVVADRFERSVHRKVACVDCHAEPAGAFDVMPHTTRDTKSKDCAQCHEEYEPIRAEFASSVHGDTTLDCTSCHDAHEFPADRATLPHEERVHLANRKCQECHNDTVYRVVGKDDAELVSTAHDWLPRPDAHLSISCIVCHAEVDDEFSHAIVPKDQATRSCEACHAEDAELIAKYVGKDDGSSVVTNPRVFEKAYVPGAVRNRLVDEILLWVAGLMALCAFMHGLLLFVSRSRHPAPVGRVERVRLYGPFLRVWHWVNALLVVVLAVTGWRLHFGGDGALFDFEGAAVLHYLAGLALLAPTIGFYVHAIATGDWRQYLTRPQDGREGIVRQARHYLSGIFRGAKHPYHPTPERRFNPLQQIAYAKVMYFLFPLAVLTGLVLLETDLMPDEVLGRPGRWWIATAHYLASAGLVLFLIAHLYLTTTGERFGDSLRAMMTGWHAHRVDDEPESAAGDDESP